MDFTKAPVTEVLVNWCRKHKVRLDAWRQDPLSGLYVCYSLPHTSDPNPWSYSRVVKIFTTDVHFYGEPPSDPAVRARLEEECLAEQESVVKQITEDEKLVGEYQQYLIDCETSQHSPVEFDEFVAFGGSVAQSGGEKLVSEYHQYLIDCETSQRLPVEFDEFVAFHESAVQNEDEKLMSEYHQYLIECDNSHQSSLEFADFLISREDGHLVKQYQEYQTTAFARGEQPCDFDEFVSLYVDPDEQTALKGLEEELEFECHRLRCEKDRIEQELSNAQKKLECVRQKLRGTVV